MQPTVPGLALFTVAVPGGDRGERAGCEAGSSWHPELRQGRIDRGVRRRHYAGGDPGNQEDGLRVDHQPPSRDRAGG